MHILIALQYEKIAGKRETQGEFNINKGIEMSVVSYLQKLLLDFSGTL